MAGWWFLPGTLVSSTNKTNRHNFTEIMLKVALNTITLNLNQDILKIYEIEHMIYPYHTEELYVYHRDLSAMFLSVLYTIDRGSRGKIHLPKMDWVNFDLVLRRFSSFKMILPFCF